jgi:hypothetical protein
MSYSKYVLLKVVGNILTILVSIICIAVILTSCVGNESPTVNPSEDRKGTGDGVL